MSILPWTRVGNDLSGTGASFGSSGTACAAAQTLCVSGAATVPAECNVWPKSISRGVSEGLNFSPGAPPPGTPKHRCCKTAERLEYQGFRTWLTQWKHATDFNTVL